MFLQLMNYTIACNHASVLPRNIEFESCNLLDFCRPFRILSHLFGHVAAFRNITILTKLEQQMQEYFAVLLIGKIQLTQNTHYIFTSKNQWKKTSKNKFNSSLLHTIRARMKNVLQKYIVFNLPLHPRIKYDLNWINNIYTKQQSILINCVNLL